MWLAGRPLVKCLESAILKKLQAISMHCWFSRSCWQSAVIPCRAFFIVTSRDSCPIPALKAGNRKELSKETRQYIESCYTHHLSDGDCLMQLFYGWTSLAKTKFPKEVLRVTTRSRQQLISAVEFNLDLVRIFLIQLDF